MKSFDRHAAHFQTLNAIRMPRMITAVAMLLMVTIAAVAAFISLVPWVQTASGSGTVTTLYPEDREQDITAFVSGRIVEWYVRDGSRVLAGDPIVRLSDNDPQLLNRLTAEQVQIELQLDAAQNGRVTAQRDAARMTSLLNDGLVSQREVEQATLKVEEFRGRIAELNAQLNRFSVNLSRQSEQVVTAPRNGFILNLSGGDKATLVSAGQTMARFVPDTPERVVQIMINGRDVALVQPGARARVQFEGWPAVQFSGWPSVAVGTFDGVVVSVDPAAQPNGQFRVLVAEAADAQVRWPQERYVRYGAGARAWILLETVPLGYELWRRMNAFPPTLPTSAEGAT